VQDSQECRAVLDSKKCRAVKDSQECMTVQISNVLIQIGFCVGMTRGWAQALPKTPQHKGRSMQ
jgi:hypothetical protein